MHLCRSDRLLRGAFVSEVRCASLTDTGRFVLSAHHNIAKAGLKKLAQMKVQRSSRFHAIVDTGPPLRCRHAVLVLLLSPSDRHHLHHRHSINVKPESSRCHAVNQNLSVIICTALIKSFVDLSSRLLKYCYCVHLISGVSLRFLHTLTIIFDGFCNMSCVSFGAL